MNLAILCDFDGTIVDIDTAEFILEKFVEDNWQQFDVELEKGEITLEECMRKQYSMIKVPRARLLDVLEQATTIRANFDKLVEYCRTREIPLIIVSAGLDFCIEHFLKLGGWEGQVEVHSAKTHFTDKGIELSFPKSIDEFSVDFKVDLIKFYRRQGKRVLYIGDGRSDYNAVRNADFSFVIKGTPLEELCQKEKIAHQSISDFQEVIGTLESPG